jgi:hypothetical protein
VLDWAVGPELARDLLFNFGQHVPITERWQLHSHYASVDALEARATDRAAVDMAVEAPPLFLGLHFYPLEIARGLWLQRLS